MNNLSSFIPWLKKWMASRGIYIARHPFNNQEAFIEYMNLTVAIESGGVLHLGAHTGQEASSYNNAGLKVVWVEAIPSIFEQLLRNIGSFPNQRAICAILGDVEGKEINFQISSNQAVSSSIFELGPESHRESFEMTSVTAGKMSRLDSLLTHEEVSQLNHWIVDLQGAELLALLGAGNLLESCNSMFIEVSTRNIYNGGVRWEELDSFLRKNNFFSLWTPKPDSHENILYLKKR